MIPHLGSGPEHCKRCGMVAVGYARIGDDRYCHGDADRPSCYELAIRGITSWDETHVLTEGEIRRAAALYGVTS